MPGSESIRICRLRLVVVLLVSYTVSVTGSVAPWSVRPAIPRSRVKSWGTLSSHDITVRITKIPRGGALSDDEESEDEYVDEEDEEYDSTDDEPEDEDVSVLAKAEGEYDEPLVPSSMMNLYASIGVMFLGRKYDLFSPTMVRIARLLFITYIIALQGFVLYVRIKARANKDRTPIEVTSPLSSVLQSQLGGDDGGSTGMVKNLASSFLSSTSTVMEYDLKQAKSMQSGLVFNMAFMWFLHFKLEQVQPLFIQAITGIVNMVYSPLFQIYVLGRNLERPFKNPRLNGLESTAEEESVDEDDESIEQAADESDDEEEDEDAESEEESVEGEESDDDDTPEEEANPVNVTTETTNDNEGEEGNDDVVEDDDD